MIITSSVSIKVNDKVRVFGGSLDGESVSMSNDIITSSSVEIEGCRYRVVVFQKCFGEHYKFIYYALADDSYIDDNVMRTIEGDFSSLVEQCTGIIKNFAKNL